MTVIQSAQAERDRARLALHGLTKREKDRILDERRAAGLESIPASLIKKETKNITRVAMRTASRRAMPAEAIIPFVRRRRPRSRSLAGAAALVLLLFHALE